ncbi:MAG: hypothetical protein WAV78_29965 [Xanthobacteraceae bacterium]
MRRGRWSNARLAHPHMVSSPIIVVCEAVLRSGAGSGSLAHLVD